MGAPWVGSTGVSFSTDLVEECCARGIPITLLKPSGKPYGRLATTALTATVRTRREQCAAYLDGRGARLARAIAAGKLRNQANLLRYFGKYCKARRPSVHADLSRAAAGILALAAEAEQLPGETVDALRPTLLNREGRGGVHGKVDLHAAIVRSCDVYFYQLAVAMGIEYLSGGLTAFGFGAPTGLDISGEQSGIVPSPEWKKRNFSRRADQVWFPGETVITGIGQGYMLVTPLQLASAGATLMSWLVPIADGGRADDAVPSLAGWQWNP